MKSFLKKILAKIPKDRLGYGGFDEIKNHPWFYSINWDKIQHCKYCGTIFGELLFCSACKKVGNCHQNCQRKDWIDHKPNCVKK